jgi:hypothetical protein
MIEEGSLVEVSIGFPGRPYTGEMLSGKYIDYTDQFLRLEDPKTNLEAWIPWDKVLKIVEVEKK